MGVTIHFEGKISNESSFQAVMTTALAYAKALGWRSEEINSPEVTLLRVRNEEEWDYVGPVRGVAFYPHPDCDPIRLEFDRDLFVQEYCKTQFAGVDVHVWVIGLLRRISEFFEKLTVLDEGEFWESEDLSRLELLIRGCNRAIDEEFKKNPHAEVKVKMPDGRITDMLE